MTDKEQINDSLKNPNKNFNENYTHEKEQIMIDLNVQECKFWQEGHCDCFLYENRYPHCLEFPNCDYKQLTRKTQECEELKRKVELMMDCPDCKVDEYEKALEEIEKATKINCEEICGRKFEDCNDTSCFSAELLDIINKAKEEGK